VLNSGTPQFEPFNRICDTIPFRSIAEKLLASHIGPDRKRLNYQLNLGYTAGANTVRDPRCVVQDFGTAMPQLNKGTKEYSYLFVTLSDVGRMMGIDFCSRAFVAGNPRLARRFERFAWRIGPTNAFEGLTIALVKISDDSPGVGRHVDDYNDTHLTSTLVVNSTLRLADGDLYRLSLIGYLRHSSDCALYRLEAAQETANLCRSFFLSESYLHPQVDMDHYFGFVGESGLTFVREATTGRFLGGGFQTRASGDKQASFLGPTISALKDFCRARDLCLCGIIEVALVIVYLNNLFLYTIVLQRLAVDNTKQPTAEGGYVGLIMEEMIGLAGSVMAMMIFGLKWSRRLGIL